MEFQMGEKTTTDAEMRLNQLKRLFPARYQATSRAIEIGVLEKRLEQKEKLVDYLLQKLEKNHITIRDLNLQIEEKDDEIERMREALEKKKRKRSRKNRGNNLKKNITYKISISSPPKVNVDVLFSSGKARREMAAAASADAHKEEDSDEVDSSWL